MRLIALDIGTKRTGVAYYDEATDIVMPLDTIEHDSPGDLVVEVRSIIDARRIDQVVLGLPLLPSGKEGSQAAFARKIGDALEMAKVPLFYVDERYSTPVQPAGDSNASAACFILSIGLKKIFDK